MTNVSETLIPGVKALHAVITPACRRNRGASGAFDEALRRLRTEYEAVLKGWTEAGKANGINLHLTLTVERLP